MSKQLTLPKIWSEPICKAWQLPMELSVSQWADQFRILDPLTSSEPGQWRTDRTPYLRGVMDAFTNPLVERITLMFSTQVGKTESFYNMLGYAIDQDPGPALIVMPREPDCKTVSKRRIIPMLRLSPALQKHISNIGDDTAQMEIALNRMIIYFAGANSPAALSGKPVRYLFLDETGKYPKFSGEEADPVKLATERTRTFWNRKIVDCSTPTIADCYVNREYEKSDRRKYYVPCPHCGGYQLLLKDQIKVPEGERDPERIQALRIAWYECSYCKGRITDWNKPKMLRAGLWIPETVKMGPRGQLPEKIDFPQTSHVGFHLNALYSPWLTFSEIIAEWFRSQDRIETLMNFINSWLAEIWHEKIEDTKPDKLKGLCRDYNKGIVPEGGILLAGGVDVQKDYFVVVIRAHGAKQESWLVVEEQVSTWEEVEKFMFIDRYPSEVQGLEPFPVHLTCFDTGYRTNEVYDICRKYPGISRAIKGKDQLTGVPFKVTTLDKYPNGKIIPKGLLLWLLDTTYFKDKISRIVHSEDAASKWHLYHNPSDKYLAWFCNEHKVLKRDKKSGGAHEVWQPVSSHAPTHFWDAEIYAMAAAEMLRVFNLREEDRPVPETAPAEKSEEKRETWIGQRSGWIRHG